MKKTDFIASLILKIKDIDGSFTDAMALELETQLRQEWGGEEVYIQQKRIRDEEKQKAVQEYLANKPLEEVTKKHGISRASLYRHLKRNE